MNEPPCRCGWNQCPKNTANKIPCGGSNQRPGVLLFLLCVSLETATSFRAGCVFFLPIFLRPRTLGRYFMIVEGLYAFKERNIKAKTKMHTLQTPALQPPRPQKAYRWVQAATWQLADTGKNRDPLGAPHLDVYVQLH